MQCVFVHVCFNTAEPVSSDRWREDNTHHSTAKFPTAEQPMWGGSLLVSVCKFIIFYPQNVEFPRVLKGIDHLQGCPWI